MARLGKLEAELYAETTFAAECQHKLSECKDSSAMARLQAELAWIQQHQAQLELALEEARHLSQEFLAHLQMLQNKL